jgi:hypothetical protein
VLISRATRACQDCWLQRTSGASRRELWRYVRRCDWAYWTLFVAAVFRTGIPQLSRCRMDDSSTYAVKISLLPWFVADDVWDFAGRRQPKTLPNSHGCSCPSHPRLLQLMRPMCRQDTDEVQNMQRPRRYRHPAAFLTILPARLSAETWRIREGFGSNKPRHMTNSWCSSRQQHS